MKYNDEGPSLTINCALTHEEISREELEKDLSERIVILNEPRPIIETLKYEDRYKKILDTILLDKLKLDGELELEEVEANKEMIREYKAIKEKEDPGVFVLPIRLEGRFDTHDLADTGSNINIIPYRIFKELGREHSAGTHDDEADSSSRTKRARVTKTVEENLLGHVYHNFLLWNNYNRTLISRYNTKLARILPKQVYSPCIVDWTVLNTLGCGDTIKEMLEIKVNEVGGDEILFTSEAWRSAFDINEPIYTELCQELYCTYEFDEVVPDDELMTKKVIKFRLCGRAYSLSVLDFARRLGLYTSAEIQDNRFETYFLGGLRNDDHFNANQYWLSINSEEEFLLSISSAKTIRKPVLRVLQKMITYGLLITSNI
ncbi:hypothetical protein Tco_1090568 [Tanacetum coccineum]|uniref:Uncharacterized protein n=1 Tax=Tanacetum coccineum TaxID=301880 RepID=A0ABQ5I4L9_9ASTR